MSLILKLLHFAVMPRNKCPCCKLWVLATEMGLQCDICELWSHANCVEISEEEYNFLNEHKGIAWFCSPCKKIIASTIKTSQAFKERRDKTDKEIADIKESVK